MGEDRRGERAALGDIKSGVFPACVCEEETFLNSLGDHLGGSIRLVAESLLIPLQSTRIPISWDYETPLTKGTISCHETNLQGKGVDRLILSDT